jgi:hypothetical protein
MDVNAKEDGEVAAKQTKTLKDCKCGSNGRVPAL